MPPPDDLGFVHHFVPSPENGLRPVTLVLPHGTGGDENDLLPLGRDLWPGAALLGVRGKVLESGKPRFFRHSADGSIDVADLKNRTDELAEFVEAASERYGFRQRNLVVVGHSNGANIAASLILLHPHHLGLAILFRVKVPLIPNIIRDFSSLSVLIVAGLHDPAVSVDEPEQLRAMLESGGADVTVCWHEGAHELGTEDLDAARTWLGRDKIRQRLAA